MTYKTVLLTLTFLTGFAFFGKNVPNPATSPLLSSSLHTHTVLQEIGYHHTPLPKTIKTINLNPNSSVGVLIENPDPEKTFEITAIKARIQAARGKQGVVKFHIYAISSEDRTLNADLLKNEYQATVDDSGEIKTFSLNEDIALKGHGVLVVAELAGQVPVSIPAGESKSLKSNMNYNIPGPNKIKAGADLTQILKHQLLDRQHPLLIGLSIQ